MKRLEKWMPAAAALAALSTFLCCLPLGIAGGVLAAGIGLAVAPLRPWLLVLSALLLGIGLVQLYRSNRSCQRRGWGGIALFLVAAVIVIGITFFPQLVAGFLAGQMTDGKP